MQNVHFLAMDTHCNMAYFSGADQGFGKGVWRLEVDPPSGSRYKAPGYEVCQTSPSEAGNILQIILQ